MRSNRALLRALGLILVTVLAVALAACGDDGGDDPETTTTTEEEETTDDSTAEEGEDDDVFQGSGDEEEGEDEEMGGGGDEQSTFADDIEDQVEAEIDLPSGTPYSGFSTIQNNDGTLTVSVPDEWDDVNGSNIDTEDEVGPAVSASTDLQQYNSGFDVPGMLFHASFVAALDTSEAAEQYGTSYDCDYLPIEPLELEDDYYFGHVSIGLDCAGTTTDFVTIAADKDGASNAVVILQVQLVTDADLEALSEILNTFLVSRPG